jgi:hypothetical protein
LALVANEDELSLRNVDFLRVLGLACHDCEAATAAQADSLVQNVRALHNRQRRLLKGTVPGLR